MLLIISTILITIGILMMTYHIYIPVTIQDWTSGMVLANNISGLVLLLVGLIIIGVRINQLGIGGLLNLPREDKIQCFLQPGHSNNTRIFTGNLLEDNIIQGKNKIIHYKGGGFRIGGHECIRVHGNVVSNIPEKIGEVLYRYREKYKVEDIYRLKKLHEKLTKINSIDPLEDQLREIPELSHIAEDEELLKEFASMTVKDVRSMAETLWDGTTVRLDPDIDEFIQTATPAQVYHYAQREYFAKRSRDRLAKDSRSGIGTDWIKYAIPIGVLMFMAALGLGVFMQMGG